MSDVLGLVVQLVIVLGVSALAGVGLVSVTPWYRRKQQEIIQANKAIGWYEGHRAGRLGRWHNPYDEETDVPPDRLCSCLSVKDGQDRGPCEIHGNRP